MSRRKDTDKTKDTSDEDLMDPLAQLNGFDSRRKEQEFYMLRKQAEMGEDERSLSNLHRTNVLNSIPQDTHALANGLNLRLSHCYGGF